MSAVTYIDACKVIHEYLTMQNPPSGTSLLYPLVGARVEIDVNPREFQNAQASVVLAEVGGDKRHSSPISAPRMEFRCYGGGDNPELARQVSLALSAQLHRANNVVCTSGVLMSAMKQGGGGLVWTPPGVWPYIVEWFRILVKPKET
ncbi:MAG: hypothetical protein WC655_24400 [Candidatus Hydrogenedentales bacterium]|jgi:hypothetical protein